MIGCTTVGYTRKSMRYSRLGIHVKYKKKPSTRNDGMGHSMLGWFGIHKIIHIVVMATGSIQNLLGI